MNSNNLVKAFVVKLAASLIRCYLLRVYDDFIVYDEIETPHGYTLKPKPQIPNIISYTLNPKQQNVITYPNNKQQIKFIL